MNNISVSAFRWAPPFAQGLVRDLRVRWALEEAGLSYAVDRIDFEDLKSGGYRSKHPFGMVPFLLPTVVAYLNPAPSCYKSPRVARH